MTKHKCGCTNVMHPSGILQCVKKCLVHQGNFQPPEHLDDAYYRKLGVLDDGGELLPTRHVVELTETLGEFPKAGTSPIALEIGCGCSPYVGAIQDAGWHYTGLDVSRWAAEWTSKHWGVKTFTSLWEAWTPSSKFGLVLAAHAIEHMRDAPAGISKMAKILDPGGELWIVVPDDGDPLNPDHFWFWTPDTLRDTLEAMGLEVEALEVRKVIERENFMYCRARKSS